MTLAELCGCGSLLAFVAALLAGVLMIGFLLS